MQFRYQESVRAYSTLTFANWSSINSSFGPQHIGGKSLPTINIIESYRALHLNINSLETVEAAEDANVDIEGFFGLEF